MQRQDNGRTTAQALRAVPGEGSAPGAVYLARWHAGPLCLGKGQQNRHLEPRSIGPTPLHADGTLPQNSQPDACTSLAHRMLEATPSIPRLHPARSEEYFPETLSSIRGKIGI